jgi:parallel beta-helix repeat protein
MVTPYYSVALEHGSIEGKVTDSSTGLPLIGANVTAVCTETYTIFYSTVTDDSGNYEFSSIEPREYVVTAFGRYGDIRYGGARKCGVAPGETIIVNFTLTPIPIDWILVPVDYATIQGAINAANEEDTVFVSMGTYYEHAVVNKSISLFGEDKYDTVIDGEGTSSVVLVTSSHVHIREFTIKGSGFNGWGGWQGSGIFCNSLTDVHITNNIIKDNQGYGLCAGNGQFQILNNSITNNWLGLSLGAAQESIVSNNIIANNTFGLSVGGSPRCILRNNTLINNFFNFGVGHSDVSGYEMDIDTSNTVNGRPIYYWVNRRDLIIPDDAGYIGVVCCINITVRNLNVSSNIQGVLLDFSQLCLIENTNISLCYNGISMFYSYSNKIKRSTISRCNLAVAMDVCSNNEIALNSFSNSIEPYAIKWSDEPFRYAGYGIAFTESSNNEVCGNRFSNIGCGMHFYASYMNMIVQNNVSSGYVRFGEWYDGFRQETGLNVFFHNNIYAAIYFGVGKHAQIWSKSYPLGGNYWYGYTGVDLYRGSYQNETGSDGIGDTPLVLNENNVDMYPLIKPFKIPGSPPEIHPSEALLSVNVFKDDIPIQSNITLFDENITTIEMISGVSSYDWTLSFGEYYVQASTQYNGFLYVSERIHLNLIDNTELAINFQFGTLTISCFDIKGKALQNCTLIFKRNSEQRTEHSDSLGWASLEVYYGDWSVEVYWMGVLVKETDITVDNSEQNADIICDVGDLKIIVVDQYGNLLEANITLTNATYGLLFSGYLNGTLESITFTQIPLVNYNLTVNDDIQTSILIDASKTTEVTIPEFPSLIILPLFIIATLLAVIVYGKKHSASQKHL